MNEDIIKDRKSYAPSDVKMNLFQKIWWRIKFLLFEAWGKDWEVILFSIFSADGRSAVNLTKFLDKKKIIKLNNENNYFE